MRDPLPPFCLFIVQSVRKGTAVRPQSATIHGELTNDGSQIVLLATGPDPAIAYAARQLELLTPLCKTSNPPGALVLPASWPAVVQLAHTYGPNWRPGRYLTAWITAELQRRTDPTDRELSFTLPADLEPFPHQIAGAHLIAHNGSGRAALWDDRRTGKTITAILGVREINATWLPKLATPNCPVIVVTPSAVVLDWVDALAEWWPECRAAVWQGPNRTRHAGYAGVYVTSWGTVAKDARDDTKSRSPLMHLDHGGLILDEGHFAKDSSAARTRAMQRLARRTPHVFVELTGTPIAHTVKDLQPRIQFLANEWLPSSERMLTRWALSVEQNYGAPQVLGLNPHTADEFYNCLLGQWRRVARADVLDEPPKAHYVREVTLPAEWRTVYDDVEEQMLAELPNGDELPSFGTLQQLSQLLQLANSAGDVTITESLDKITGLPKKHYHVTPKLPSWKVDATLDVLRERSGQPIVIAAPSRPLIELAGCEITRQLGRRVGYIIGGQGRTRRQQTKAAFQGGELDTLCMTTGAGGTGIALHAAATLVYIQRPYSFIESEQSEDRLSGIGASPRTETEIIDIVARDTVDSRIRAVLRGKAGQFSELVRDPRIVAEILGGNTVTKRKAS